MSTYVSDHDLNLFETANQIDVAYCMMGTDVRVSMMTDCSYLTPDEARAMAVALTQNADLCEAAREWERKFRE